MNKRIITILTATSMALGAGVSASAQEIFDYRQNPYGLVYRNAITANAGLIDCPLLIMSGSKSDTDYMSREAYVKAGTKDKEFYPVKRASHIQTYYVPEYVDDVVGKMKEFFGNKL